MTQSIPAPNFKPNERVMCYNGVRQYSLCVSTVEYCLYNEIQKKWEYVITGFSCKYDDSDLTLVTDQHQTLVYNT